MEQLPIDSDTINKTLDIVDESTKETRKELDKTAAKGVNKLAQLFWASPIGRKADIYIAERPYKMELELKKMQQKYNSIPVEYQVEPSSYIALKGTSELNYVLDEEHLREMFENLLISDMDSRKQGKVLPSYIEIIKQLSKDDAIFLKQLKDENLIRALPIIRLKLTNNNNSSFNYVSNHIICLFDGSFREFPPIVLDNLLRLQIITIPYDQYIVIDVYDKVFKLLKETEPFIKYNNIDNKHLDFDKMKIEFTQFGKNFIDICLS